MHASMLWSKACKRQAWRPDGTTHPWQTSPRRPVRGASLTSPSICLPLDVDLTRADVASMFSEVASLATASNVSRM